MLELYLLRQLAAFKEYGTLSEAAERLYLSQPALSRNMRKLEEEIGVPLSEANAECCKALSFASFRIQHS